MKTRPTFKKSFLVAMALLAVVMASSFIAQMQTSAHLPSSYDPGIYFEDAVKTTSSPMLLEFYSDKCGSCQKMAPILHKMQQRDFKDRLKLVMIDVNDPKNRPVVEVFGIEALPAVFVLDLSPLRKVEISNSSWSDWNTLHNAIENALSGSQT